MKTAIQKNVRTLKAKAEAEAKAQKKADREARDKALLLQATRMAEADANARQLQRRAMGAAAYREAHPMVVNMSIDGIVGASVTLGHSNVVERQTAEFALSNIIRAFTQLTRSTP
jgi:hypothetical protein